MKRVTKTIAVLGLSWMPLLVYAADEEAAPPPVAADQGPAQLQRELDVARAKLQDDARKVAELSMQLNGPDMSPFYVRSGRGGDGRSKQGHLGVEVTETTADRDRNGAAVSAVTPDSPADKAGLKVGDVITAIDGASLKPDADEGAIGKLLDVMRKVKPGDTVTLAYLRDGKPGTAKAVADGARDSIAVHLPGFMRRPVIGVDVGPDNGDGSVTVVAVTPDGPADRAGLRAGDELTSIDGTPLKAADGMTSRDALFAAMDKVRPGDKVTVGYTRDGTPTKVTVKAASPRDFLFSFPMPPIPPMPPMAPMTPQLPAMPAFDRGFFFFGDRWGQMQLAAVSPGLGKYFGTDRGLLVLNAPKDSALQLQDGDVITSIGGRDPGSPSHAMRILRSYGPGESVKIDIMRLHKSVTLNVRLPKARDYSHSSSAFNWVPGADGKVSSYGDGS